MLRIAQTLEGLSLRRQTLRLYCSEFVRPQTSTRKKITIPDFTLTLSLACGIVRDVTRRHHPVGIAAVRANQPRRMTDEIALYQGHYLFFPRSLGRRRGRLHPKQAPSSDSHPHSTRQRYTRSCRQ